MSQYAGWIGERRAEIPLRHAVLALWTAFTAHRQDIVLKIPEDALWEWSRTDEGRSYLLETQDVDSRGRPNRLYGVKVEYIENATRG